MYHYFPKDLHAPSNSLMGMDRELKMLSESARVRIGNSLGGVPGMDYKRHFHIVCKLTELGFYDDKTKLADGGLLGWTVSARAKYQELALEIQ